MHRHDSCGHSQAIGIASELLQLHHCGQCVRQSGTEAIAYAAEDAVLSNTACGPSHGNCVSVYVWFVCGKRWVCVSVASLWQAVCVCVCVKRCVWGQAVCDTVCVWQAVCMCVCV